MATQPNELRTRLVALLPSLRRYAYALAGNRHDADDLVQAAIIRALSHLESADSARSLQGWMYRTIRNLRLDERGRAANRWPHASVEELGELEGADGRSVVEARSDLARAQRLLDVMNPDLRAAAVLVIVDGLAYREAAELLQVPLGTVMSRVSRARRALAEGLRGASQRAEGRS